MWEIWRLQKRARNGPVWATSSLLLILAVGAWPQSVPMCAEDRRTDAAQLEAPLAELVSWHAFWYGPEFTRRYKAGMRTDTTVVTFGDDVVLFMAQAGIMAEFKRLGDGALRAWSVSLIQQGSSNRREVADYMSLHVHDTNGGASRDSRFMREPAARSPGSEAPAPPPPCQADLTLRLLPLRVPDYMEIGEEPAELPSLLAIVRDDLSLTVRACGGTASAIVPFFGSQDPWVFVEVTKKGGSCDVEGTAVYRRDEQNRWLSAPKIEPSEPGSRIMKMIGSHAARTVSVP